MKIMQMAFMIMGVFFFFILVGLFFITITFKDIRNSAGDLATEEAISSLKIISSTSELNYNSRYAMSVDEDKLKVLASGKGEDYEKFWPVASLEVYKVYPQFSEVIPCPASDCNYYKVYDSGQKNVQKISSYVSICKRVKEFGSAYDKCEIGKMVVGVKIISEEDNGI